jgi:ATP-dependent Clp protease protease subunit
MAEFTIKTYDPKIHNIYLKDEVNEEMWQLLVDKINEIKSADKEIDEMNVGTLSLFGIEAQAIHPPINIYLNTYGGDVLDMFAIYDEIKALSSEYIVNIFCVGKVISAGTIIMLAVDNAHRFAYPHTTFMYHTLSSFAYGKMKDLEESTEASKRFHQMMWNIYKENTKIPEEKLNEIYNCKKDWYITSEQAKKYKIISKIIQ